MASPALCCNIDLQNIFIEWSQKPYRRLNPSDNFRDHGTLLLFIDLQNGEPDESAETSLFRDNFSRIHSPDCIV